MQENRMKYPISLVYAYGEYFKICNSLKDTAKKFNVSYEWVKQNLLKYGYRIPTKKLPNQRNNPITYFNKIDSHNKAYILGLMFSDGYVCKTPYGHSVGIALKLEDKYILEFIASEWNIPTSKIGVYKNSCKLSICNESLYSDLIQLGIVENKSNSEIRIPEIPSEYYNSFVAGVFDGDGCITIKSSGAIVVSICCNSKSFLKDIQQILTNNNITTRPIKLEKGSRKNNLFILYLSKRENQIKFGDFIYKNLTTKLVRKYNKFMKIPRKSI